MNSHKNGIMIKIPIRGIIMFRKATLEDLNAIEAIYNDIHTEEEQGRAFINWKREVYPTKETAQSAILEDDMFVELDNGIIVASARINKKQVAEYADAAWSYQANDDEVMVIHTLAVAPKFKGRGYGSKFVKFYEEYAVNQGCRFLRLDTWENNLTARSLYKKLGYNEVGIVTSEFNGISGFRLVCLEKKL